MSALAATGAPIDATPFIVAAYGLFALVAAFLPVQAALRLRRARRRLAAAGERVR